jgi:hypothetical protein
VSVRTNLPEEVFVRMYLSKYHPVVFGRVYWTKVLKQLQAECTCVVFIFFFFFFFFERERVSECLTISCLSAHAVGHGGLM